MRSPMMMMAMVAPTLPPTAAPERASGIDMSFSSACHKPVT
jgi:hypothetical protein